MSLCVGNLAHSIKAIQLKLKYKSTNFVQALEGGVNFCVHVVAKEKFVLLQYFMINEDFNCIDRVVLSIFFNKNKIIKIYPFLGRRKIQIRLHILCIYRN